MKYLTPLLAITCLSAMDVHITIVDREDRKTSQDSAASVSEDILKPFIKTYLKKDNEHIEARILPHLSEKFDEFPDELKLFKNAIEQPQKFEDVIHLFITDALDDAFKKQDEYFQKYKEDQEDKIRNARYGLATAIFAGIFSTLTAVLTTYFSIHH